MTSNKLLRESEAAEFLGTTGKTLNVCRTRKTGAFAALPYVKNGKSVRYQVSDLMAFVEANTIRA